MSIPGCARRGGEVEQTSQRAGCEFQELSASWQTSLAQPTGFGHALKQDIVVGNRMAYVHRQLEVAAGQKTARPGVSHVRRQEVVARNAIAVGEHQIVGSRFDDRTI